MKKFSFVVPVYKTAGFLKRCLLSIMDQDYPEWEIIVVLDGHDKKAEGIVKEFIRNQK